MKRQTMPGVVCAGGHGKVRRPGLSKLADSVGDKPILERVIENMKESRFVGDIIVVVNHLMREELQGVLESYGHDDLFYAVQYERRGAANAVHCALPLLQQWGVQNFLSVFGEMPFIQPDTLDLLAETHFAGSPDMTLLTCQHDVQHPLATALQKYAYLKQGWDNGHRTNPFLYMYRPEPAEQGDDIIGSAYGFRTKWFADVYPHIQSMDNKRDGFGPEYHLPKFIEYAVVNRCSYANVRRDVHPQILGINNLEDYRLAESVCLSVAAVGR